MKYELKIEISETKKLRDIIEKSYFEDSNGKLKNKTTIHIPTEDPMFIMLKGMNNMTARISNPEIIDGTLRCIIIEDESGVEICPCSIYCMVEDEKYSFY